MSKACWAELMTSEVLKAEGLLETSIGVASSRLTRGKTGVIKAVSITFICSKQQGVTGGKTSFFTEESIAGSGVYVNG